MAFEFQKRRLFNPATIAVNRGGALERAAQQQGAAGFNLAEGLRQFVDKKTAETKSYEEERAKKLAGGATIVYEDITYTGADGIERTRKIAKNYKTPENLLGTSWAATTFDEEAAKVYTDAAANTANEILNMEKELSKENSRFDQDVAEVTALFDANIQEPMAALRETIPDELKTIFDSNVKTNIERTRSTIADRQYNKVLGFNKASFNKLATDYENQFGSLFAGDPTEGLKLLNELKEKADILSLKNVEAAHIWSTQLYKPYELMLNAGVRAQRFLQIDYDDVDSLAQAHSNLKNMELLLNFQGQKISLVNAQGETESITLKDLGLDGTDNQIARNKVMAVLSKQRTLITDLFTKEKSSTKNLNYINNTLAIQTGGQDNGVDGVTLSAKKDSLAFSAAIDQNGTKETKALVDLYIAEYYPDGGTTIDSDNIIGHPEEAQYKQWVASKFHKLGGKENMKIVSMGNSLSKQPNAETRLQLKDDLVNFLSTSAWANATSAVHTSDKGTVIATHLIEKIPGLGDKGKEEFAHLAFAVGQTSSVQEAADLYLRNRILEPKVNDEFFKEIYGESIGAIDTKIKKEVLNEFSDVNFGADNMIAYRFMSNIARQVKINLADTSMKLSVEGETQRIMNNLIQKEGYGFSEYSYAFTTSTDDPDEVDMDQGKVFTRYSTDEFFNTHPSRLPETIEPVLDPLSLTALYDKNYLKNIQEYGATGTAKRKSFEKTPLYYEIQEELKEHININNTNNPQFQIEEEPVLGKNIKLFSIGEPTGPDGVVYQIMYLPNKEGTRARPVLDYLGNNLTISRRELVERSGDSNTNIDKHVKINSNFGKVFSQSADMLAKQFSPLYKGK